MLIIPSFLKYKWQTLWLVVLLFADQSYAGKITLDYILERAVITSPYIKSQLIGIQVEQSQREIIQSEGAWRLKSGITTEYREILETTDPNIFIAQEDESTLSGNIGLEKQILDSGAKISFKGNYNSQYQAYKNAEEEKSKITELQLEYRLPLAKNANGVKFKTELAITHARSHRARLNASEKTEHYLLDMAKKYIEWVKHYEIEQLIKTQIANTSWQLAKTKEKVKLQLIDQADEIRIQAVLNEQKIKLMQTISDKKAIAQELSTLLDDNTIRENNPRFEYSKMPSTLDMSVLEDTIDSLRQIKELRLQLNEKEYEITRQKNDGRSKLEVISRISVQNNHENQTDSLNDYKPGVYFGVEYETALGNTPSDAKIHRNQLEHQQLLQRLEDKIVTIKSKLQRLIVMIQAQSSIIDLKKNQISAAKTRTKYELKRYLQGRGDLNFVLDARNYELQTQESLTESYSQFHNKYLDYLALIDKLLRK